MITNKTLMIVSGSAKTLVWFRLELMEEFLKKSFKVIAVAPDDLLEDQRIILEKLGVEFLDLSLNRKSLNILDLMKSVIHLRKKFKKYSPSIVITYTFKASIATAFASLLIKNINIFALVTGRGHIFDDASIKESIRMSFGILGLRLAFKKMALVFFQNNDDRLLFLEKKIIMHGQARITNGSGVNLEKFKESSLPEGPVFMTMARLIQSKGLIEFAEASNIVKQTCKNARFLLCGYPDTHSDSISEDEIKNKWKSEYGIEYLGFSESPQEILKQCSVFVLLSYKEGTPRSVLEAMSMGRPIITTDTVGCRETVIENYNGHLVPVKDSIAAAEAMLKMVDDKKRAEMGQKSRLFCEEKFNVQSVNRRLIQEIFGVLPFK
jgi:glycosyltransferase involved in cell wall biosynthesis